MSSVPLAANRLRIPRFEGPLDQYRKMVQLKSLMQGQQLNQARLGYWNEQKAGLERKRRDQEILQRAYLMAEGDEEKTIREAIKQGASPEIISAYRKSMLEDQKTIQGLEEKDLELSIKRAENLSNAIGSFNQNVPAEARQGAYPAFAKSLIQGGLVPAEQVPQQYPGDEQANLISMMMTKDLERRKHELAKRKERGQERADFEDWYYPLWLETTGKKKNAANARKAWWDFQKSLRGEKPGVDVPFPPEVEAQKKRIQRARPASQDIRNREATLVEDEAANALRAAAGDADRAIESVNRSPNIDTRLKAKIRSRIRDRVRQGARAPSDIEELGDILRGGGATAKTTTRETVEAFARSKGISYQEAAQQLQAAGYTIQ